jgi:hypothetical protein
MRSRRSGEMLGPPVVAACCRDATPVSPGGNGVATARRIAGWLREGPLSAPGVEINCMLARLDVGPTSMWDRIYVGPTFQSVIEFMWDRLSSRSLRECHCVSTGWKAGPTDSHRGLRRTGWLFRAAARLCPMRGDVLDRFSRAGDDPAGVPGLAPGALILIGRCAMPGAAGIGRGRYWPGVGQRRR